MESGCSAQGYTGKKSESSDDQELLDMLLAATNKVYDEKVALVGHEAFAQFERNVLLQFLDQRWREHLSQLDMLRQASISAATLRNSRNRNTSAKLLNCLPTCLKPSVPTSPVF